MKGAKLGFADCVHSETAGGHRTMTKFGKSARDRRAEAAGEYHFEDVTVPPARTRAAKAKSKSGTAKRRSRFAPPQTVSHADLLASGTDEAFRETIYVMALALSRLQSCREAFGRATSLQSQIWIPCAA